MARPYRQTARAQSAERTKADILRALDRRMRSKRHVPLSVDLIAQDAGVARSTVYGVFGSRAGLFDAYTELLWHQSGMPRLVDAVRAQDPVEHLRNGILEASRMFAADLPVFRRLFAMDALDPDALGGAVRRMEADRLGGMRHLAQRLHEAGRLLPGMDVDEATDVLWTLCSFAALDLQLSGRDRPVDDAARLLADAAEHALCGVDTPRRAGRDR